MIKNILWTLAGIVAGAIAAFLLVIGIEAYSAAVHPLPPDFSVGAVEDICRHVERYPQWVLATVVPMWGLAAFVGTWLARRIGNIVSATLVGSLLIAAVGLNLAMLPYPIWFKVANLLVVPAAITAGIKLARRRPGSPAENVEQQFQPGA